MPDDKRKDLAGHLWNLMRGYTSPVHNDGRYWGWDDDRVARGIMEHPQLHIDALVAAAVLQKLTGVIGFTDEPDPTACITGTAYRVVPLDPPHAHDYRWVPNGNHIGRVRCIAPDCDAEFIAPMEQWPKYEGGL